jgi:hypothetical protein
MRFDRATIGLRVSLSLRERAGVRERDRASRKT